MERQMVVLDQHGIEQPHSMIRAAAARNGIFVQEPQARNRLPRIDDARLRSPHAVHVMPRHRRDTAHALQHIECDAFDRKY